MSGLPDSADLRAIVRPTADEGWRYDITAGDLDGTSLWLLTGVDSWGWARSRERAEEKARKRLAKVRRRLDNLAQPASVVS